MTIKQSSVSSNATHNKKIEYYDFLFDLMGKKFILACRKIKFAIGNC